MWGVVCTKEFVAMQEVKKRLVAYRREKSGDQRSIPESSAERREGSREDDVADGIAHSLEDERHSQSPPTSNDSTITDGSVQPLAPFGRARLILTVLKAVLWILLWGFFIEVGFGAVYFVTSLLFFIVVSLRGSRRKPWEPSAYSVFNPNFETIQGTLTAEQFERELRYGPASVKK